MWFLEKVGGGGDFSCFGRREQELSRGTGPAKLASSPARGPSAMPGAGPLPPGPWLPFLCEPLPPPRCTLSKTCLGSPCVGFFFRFSLLENTFEGSRCHLRPHYVLYKEPKCGNELLAFLVLSINVFLTSGFFFLTCVLLCFLCLVFKCFNRP